MNGKTKCQYCQEETDECELVTIDDNKICADCEIEVISADRETAGVTIEYSNGDVATIGDYHDDTQGEFTAGYHRIDGWRGYHTVESTNWINIHDDNILELSKDADNLENFVEILCEKLDEKDVRYAKAYCQTSNVLCASFDLFVYHTDLAIAKKVLKKLQGVKDELRNPVDYSRALINGL